MEDIQNVDNPADQVMEECLSNPVVLRRILEHFTNAELLHKLSFVNKLWNYEARSLLSKRGDLVASFKHICCSPCQNFTAFAQDLRRMNVAPFFGIHVHLLCNYGWPNQLSECRLPHPDPTLEPIFDKLTLKKISLKMDHVLWNSRMCFGFLLIEKILYHYSKVLEILSLDQIFKQSSLWLVQDCNFPRLKTLKLENQNWLSPISIGYQCEPFTEFIKPMLSKAPNLEVLHSGGDMNQLSKVLQGSSVVLVYNDEVTAPFHDIPDSLIGAMRLKKIILSCSDPEFDVDRFNRIATILLQASTTTLCEVRVDAILAVPLMCYGVCLKNVKDLIMWINYDQLEYIEPRLLRTVKDFDFTRIFPTLEKVQVNRGSGSGNYSRDHMSKIIEEASAVLGEPLLHRAVNIQQLNMNIALSNVTAPFFAEMFPNIAQLEVGQALSWHGEVAFGSIWKHWKDLETLEVRADITGNLDSLFCGIFPEEVAELEQKDDEYLKRVNIVPVIPAITCLRNLRTFTFKFSRIQDPTFQFSKVTGLIAFMRCPTLTVNLSTYNKSAYTALSHMEPYTSFIHKGLPTTSPLDVIKSIVTRRVQ